MGKSTVEQLMNVSAVSEALGVSIGCVYSMLESGKLAGYRIGNGRGTWRVSVEQLQEFLNRNETGGEKKQLSPPVKLKHITL